jgi:DNA-directed RNA polymerase specialized sigma24 family protein
MTCREWDIWFEENYADLLSHAKRMSLDSVDLVHHVYLLVREKESVNHPWGYMLQIMWREAKSGRFAKLYKTSPELPADVPDEREDLTYALRKEQMQLFVDGMHEFDRIVWHLYNDGYSMVEIAKGSKVPKQTLYNSLNETRKKIKKCFLLQQRRENRD